MLNKCILVGNMTADPELRYTRSGTAVVSLRIATSNSHKTKDGEIREEKLYINAVVWSKRAENCARYLKKGMPVFVSGRLISREWQDKNGQRKESIDLNVEDIQFLNRSKEGTSKEDIQ